MIQQPIPLFPRAEQPNTEPTRGGFADVELAEIRERALARSAEIAQATNGVVEDAARYAREQQQARSFVAASRTKVAEANRRLLVWSVIGMLGTLVLIPRLAHLYGSNPE